jgi:hypothetical protein
MTPRESKRQTDRPPPAGDDPCLAEGEIDRLRRLVGELTAQRDELGQQLRAAQVGGDAAAEFAELRRRVAAQAEALQGREARRQMIDALLREREATIEERDAQVARLTAALESLQLRIRKLAAPPAYVHEAEQRTPAAAAPVRTAAAAAVAEARSAALAHELHGLHPRSLAASLDWPGAAPETAAGAPPASGGLQAEVAALRAANAQLRADLADQEARITSVLASPDTGAFVATSDLVATGTGLAGAAADGGSSARADSPLCMLVRTEGDTGIVHVLGRRTTIGRTPDNDLCIDSESVSRHHAVALQTAGGTVIEDLNSTNGIYVNGHRSSRRQLAEGDVLTIGKASFRYLVKPADDVANS